MGSRIWCSLSIDFSESNSLDPESVDSSFPIFDIHFVPIAKESVANWKKPFVDILRVNERLKYAEFAKQTRMSEWIKKEKNALPADLEYLNVSIRALQIRQR